MVTGGKCLMQTYLGATSIAKIGEVQLSDEIGEGGFQNFNYH